MFVACKSIAFLLKRMYLHAELRQIKGMDKGVARGWAQGAGSPQIKMLFQIFRLNFR